MKPEMCVGGIALKDGCILLIRRGHPPGKGQWSVPGGRVEEGERLADAVVREMAEETGLECKCGEMVGLAERFGNGFHFVIADYLVTPVDPGANPRASGDADEVRWVPLEALDELPLVEGLSSFLAAHGVIDDKELR